LHPASRALRFVQKRLDSLKKLQAIPFHDDGVCSLSQGHIPLAGRVHQERKQGLGHIGGVSRSHSAWINKVGTVILEVALCFAASNATAATAITAVTQLKFVKLQRMIMALSLG
jgi:hypothetical protein